MGKFYGRRMVPEYLIKKLEKGPFKLTTDGSIKDLTTDEINELKAGDIVLKTTGNQKHAYIVSYKEEGQGICLTYTDASCIETVSFDYTGGEWVYNSTDIVNENILNYFSYNSTKDEINTSKPIVETLSGYSYTAGSSPTGSTKNIVYAGVVKNGNKLTFVVTGKITRNSDTFTAQVSLGTFYLPANVLAKLIPTTISGNDFLDVRKGSFAKNHTTYVDLPMFIQKGANSIYLYANISDSLTLDTEYYFRYEATFLLSESLI